MCACLLLAANLMKTKKYMQVKTKGYFAQEIQIKCKYKYICKCIIFVRLCIAVNCCELLYAVGC